MSLLTDIQNKILIGDGAMGTLLYSYGVDRCFEELNISLAEQVEQIHQAYVTAGANIIQTNTYGANYEKLSRYGLEDDIKQINKLGVQIAKKAAKDQAYVIGTIGAIRGIKKKSITLEEIKRNFREQLYYLLSEDIDGILLETYYDLEEILTVIELARRETELPLIAQVSLHEVGVMQGGIPVTEALSSLENAGADIVGLNCRLGPYHMIRSFEEIPLPKKAFLSAYPNGSLPAYVDGRFVYQSDPDYFKRSAQALRDQGVRLIGGCCGTTPEHIAAAAEGLRHAIPITQKKIRAKESIHINQSTESKELAIHQLVKKRPTIIVELDPPKKLSIDKFFQGAKALEEAGVEAITMADNSLASPRVSNMAMASLLKQKHKVRPLVHVTCRDRNLIGLQSHLMGLHSLGINQLLAITGDPTKIGDFPGASSVYDLSSIELIQLMKQFNEGISFSGKPLGMKSNFSVAAAFNPNVRHLDKAVQRLEKKVEAGADYFISQPLYSEQQIIDVYEATKHITAPIFIGIMPLTGTRNAEFLHNEVPGIKLPDEVRQRMASCGDDAKQAVKQSIAIAKELIDVASTYFKGIYLITPFMRYELTVELTTYFHQLQQVKESILATQEEGKQQSEKQERNNLHGRNII